MKKILFFFLLGLVTRREAVKAQADTMYTIEYVLSPLDSAKPYREKTVAIVLHTMEGYHRGGLKRMVDSALCNYTISYTGKIICIVDKYKVSNHAGRSIWDGDTMFSRYSIGIEFEGFSALPPTRGQLAPHVAAFIADLQREFGIADSMVLIHPVVACYYPYSKDNPYPGEYVRGRKRDAYYFADNAIRAEIGLGPMVTIDPDVRDGIVRQYIPQAKRFRMHIYSKEEIADRVAYLARLEKRRQDSIEASRVQPIDMCTIDCIATIEPELALRQKFVMQDVHIAERKQFFSLSPFLLPRRLRVKP